MLAQGTLDELAGAPEMIVQIDGPVDPTPLAALLHCGVTLDGPPAFSLCDGRVVARTYRRGHHELPGEPRALDMVSLRTRASLEERYLELIADERDGAPGERVVGPDPGRGHA